MTLDPGTSIAWYLAASAALVVLTPARAGTDWPVRHDLVSASDGRDLPNAERVGDGWLWTVQPGEPGFLPIAYEGVEASEWDQLAISLRVLDGGLRSLGVKVVDAPLGDGMELWFPAPDALREPTDEPVEFRAALRKPAALWGQRPDAVSQWITLRAESDRPARVLLCGASFEREPLRVVADPAEYDAPAHLRAKVHLANPTEEPLSVSIEGAKESVRLAPHAEAALDVTLRIHAEKRAPLDRVSAPLKLTYEGRSLKAQETEATIEAIAPLPRREHPYLFAGRDDLLRAKALAKTEDWAREHVESTLSRAEETLAGDLTIPQSYGQWGHWYACSKCGSGLRAESPTRHVCTNPDCGEVHTGYPYDQVYAATQHNILADRLVDMGLAYQWTDDERCAEAVVGVLLQYADAYLTDQFPQHDIHGNDTRAGARVMAQPLDESGWMLDIVWAYDLVAASPAMTLEADERIRTRFLLPAAKVIRGQNLAVHNIQCWLNSAMAAIGFACDDPELVAHAYANPVSGFRAQMERGVMEDGLWWELSWGYHFYTLTALVPFLRACEEAGIATESPRLKALWDAPLRCAYPDGALPRLNDGGAANVRGMARLYETAYARWRDPAYWAVLRDTPRSRDALLLGAFEPPTDEPGPVGSCLLPASGLAILRADTPSGPVVTYLDYGPHGGGHGHPDKLGVARWALGREISPDAGSVSYGLPVHGEYYRQTIAHNTVGMDMSPQERTTGKLLFWQPGPIDVVSAMTDDAYEDVTMARTLIQSGEVLVDVFDILAAEGADPTWDWVWRIAGDLTAAPEMTPFNEPLGADYGYQYFTEVRRLQTDADFTFTCGSESGPCSVTLLAAPGGEYYLGEAPGVDPSKRIPTLVARRHGTSARFVAVHRLGTAVEPPTPVSVEPTGAGLAVRIGDDAVEIAYANGAPVGARTTGPDPR